MEALLQDGYNPYVIGYDHPKSLNELPSVKREIEEIRRNHQGVLKVGLEIDYAQVGHIKDFLPLEKEYNETGKINGEVPGKKPEEYRRKLTANHSENLALWLLENDIDVITLESPDVRSWINQDKGLYLVEEDFFGENEPIERQGLTAIRRDIHGLGIINTQRPDVISAGTAHALKYDLLLRRNGERSFYFLESPLDWQRTLNMWQEVHARYKSTA